jgi:hypothetical protein
VLRAARAAPATVVAHLERWALVESISVVTSGSEWQAWLRGIAMPGIVQFEAIWTSTGRRRQDRQARAPSCRVLFLSGVFHASPRYGCHASGHLLRRSSRPALRGARFPHAKSTGRLIDEAPNIRLFYRFSSACLRGYSRSAQQGARANADICHAACDRMSFEVKNPNPVPNEARGAPDAVVAHL